MGTETATIAGQTWTVDRTFRHVVLLTNDRGITTRVEQVG